MKNKNYFSRLTILIILITINHYGCDDITDIFPPKLNVNSPNNNDIISENFNVSGSASDNNKISNVKVYTKNILGDKWLEGESKISDFNFNFPLWSHGINNVIITAYDDVGNFKTEKIKILTGSEYDMGFEDLDYYQGWKFQGELYSTNQVKHSGQSSLVLYGSRSNASGVVSLSKLTRSGHISFYFYRNSGCYSLWPEIQFLVDGEIIFRLEAEEGIENIDGTDWTFQKIKVDEGNHNFTWKVSSECSSGNFLFLDSLYIP
jgi:hypothetical protein